MNAKLLFLLILPFLSVAQKTDTIPKSKVKANIYIGFSGFFQKYNLNSKLNAKALPIINENQPALTVGLNFIGEKYSGSIETGFLFTENELSGNKTQYIGFNSTGRFHYNVINKKQVAFTTGLALSYTSNQVNVFSNDNTIDLNDLTPNNNSGHINIKNGMLYTGPSVDLYIFRNKKFPIKLSAAYEIALTRGRWKSDFGNVLNTVQENSNNRFSFGITFL